MIAGVPLGSIVVFRYLARTARDPRPTVFILSTAYNGLVHGLNVRYLTPVVQQQLQWYFLPKRQQQTQLNPFQQQQNDYVKKLEEYQKRKNELLQKQQGVIVKPADNGSPFGVSTFGKTQQAVVPARQILPPNQREDEQIQEPEPPPVLVPPTINSPFSLGSNQKIPTNPFQFYHQIVKPLLGKDVSRVYRTYKPMYIMNVRMIKSVRRFF